VLERHDVGEESALRRFAKTSNQPQGRMRAVWTLAGLSACKADDVRELLNDPDPGVRRQGLLLNESHLKSAIQSDVMRALLSDSEAAVRFQARLCAGTRVPEGEAELGPSQLAIIANDEIGRA